MSAKSPKAGALRSAYTKADMEDVSDAPEFTREEMAAARPFVEVLPEVAASVRRVRGKQRAPTKQLSASASTVPSSTRSRPKVEAGRAE